MQSAIVAENVRFITTIRAIYQQFWNGIMYDGTCKYCFFYEDGICTDKSTFSRYGKPVNGEERKDCYRTQIDVMYKPTHQTKLF